MSPSSLLCWHPRVGKLCSSNFMCYAMKRDTAPRQFVPPGTFVQTYQNAQSYRIVITEFKTLTRQAVHYNVTLKRIRATIVAEQKQ
jgi:hypothetical protein